MLSSFATAVFFCAGFKSYSKFKEIESVVREIKARSGPRESSAIKEGDEKKREINI